MKKYFFVILISLATAISIGSIAKSIWQGKTLSSSEVKKRWGSETLDFRKFKNGSLKDKSSMTYSILTNKDLIGKPVEYIRENFGSPDGFYFIDAYPAYIIQEGANHREETWQIVFKLNNKYQVKEILIHKNCCE